MPPFSIQGTHVAVDDLLALQAMSADLRKLRPQISRARQLGEQRSRQRGQGLEFAEMKPYHASDDVRRIDWRLTARKQQPYVRVMEEDRHQEHVIWLPLHSRLYFGTRRCFKSVLLCHWSAFLIWRFAHLHHPVRLIIDIGHERRQQTILNQRHAAEACRVIAEAHQQLAEDFRDWSEPAEKPVPNWASNPTLWVLSDFLGDEIERCRDVLQHRSVASLMYLQCSDPFDHRLPKHLRLPVRSGDQLSSLWTDRLDAARPSMDSLRDTLQEHSRVHHGSLIHHESTSFTWQEVQQWPLYH